MLPMTAYFAESALLPSGWARNVGFDISADGNLAAVTADAEAGDSMRLSGPVIPGMPNLHSHGFQRAMAGLAERAGSGGDSFWTWRKVMYGFVGRLSPDHVEAIAAQLYVEMLKSGYTAVGEFHYLHHGPDGSPYDDPGEMSHRMIAAARAAGIGITHLPVLYAHGGFGGAEAGPGQRRFLHGPDDFMALVDGLLARYRRDPDVRIGIALHSLRAVTPELLGQTVAALDARDGAAPIHIHVAEQQLEVDDCLAWSAARPVEWLLDHGANPNGDPGLEQPPLPFAVELAKDVPYETAATSDAFAIIGLLIKSGADPLENRNGHLSAIQRAMDLRCESCISFIRQVSLSRAADLATFGRIE